jgi:hypothetical protein
MQTLPALQSSKAAMGRGFRPSGAIFRGGRRIGSPSNGRWTRPVVVVERHTSFVLPIVQKDEHVEIVTEPMRDDLHSRLGTAAKVSSDERPSCMAPIDFSQPL